MSGQEISLFMYYDVTADGIVAPLDVLRIINVLNTREGSAEGKYVAISGRRNDLLIGGSAESQDDLASRAAVLADSGSDWALSLFDLGDVDDDDQEVDLRGESGIDMFFGAFGDKFT